MRSLRGYDEAPGSTPGSPRGPIAVPQQPAQPQPPAPPLPRTAPRARAALLASMVLAVVGIGALAEADNARESAAALEDFAQEQATLATSISADLGTRLALARRDAALPIGAPQLLAGMVRLSREGESVLLVRPPGSERFLSPEGREFAAPRLAAALSAGQRTLRLERPEAAALGLPPRLAIAGLASVDAGALGRWGIAIVATASRERDRERRATLRLVLSMLLAVGLVGAFGGLALRQQRHELRLARDLALAEAGRQREEKLDKLDKAATMLTMASGMAHELGTPLGVIVGRAEQLATRSAGDEKAQRAAQAILDQAANIHSVMRGFLDLARGSAPAMQLVAPADVVAAAVALVEHRFTKAGVQLAIDAPEVLPLLRCEPRLLEHALVNLLLNACDACPRGGSVGIAAESHPGVVRFVVVDDGTGISDADAARVTEPFFTTKPAGKGTGLGLAIVSEIAKSHRGSLVLAPAGAAGGTRACVQIPLSPEAARG